jgi:predicted lipid-binding transport protein (Tim44 family)
MLLRARRQPAYASSPSQAPSQTSLRDMLNRQSLGGSGSAAAATGTLSISQKDLGSFERLLGEIQLAYGREDVQKLGNMTTPEMLSYFSQDLANNANRGVRNEISDVKLLQGDISEAWRDGGSDYATVAMRYTIVDAMVDRASGKIVSGDANNPTQATEFWTFRRDQRAPNEGWQLSAIQQVAA